MTNVLEKHCKSCGRKMEPRRRWRDSWNEVQYCSRACRARRVNAKDRQLESAIIELLEARHAGATICPSEAARRIEPGDGWRRLMEPSRRAARHLANHHLIDILQGGRIVDPSDFRGPIRLRARDCQPSRSPPSSFDIELYRPVRRQGPADRVSRQGRGRRHRRRGARDRQRQVCDAHSP